MFHRSGIRVTNGSGTISGEHVNDISIACITEQYTVSVDVSGLDTNSTSLILRNNGGDDLTISANGIVSFPAQDDDSDYEYHEVSEDREIE